MRRCSSRFGRIETPQWGSELVFRPWLSHDDPCDYPGQAQPHQLGKISVYLCSASWALAVIK